MWIIYPGFLSAVTYLSAFSLWPHGRKILQEDILSKGPVYMINSLFNDTTQIALERALDASSTRTHLIAHNIANADTPNFKAVRLRFEDVLARELDREDELPPAHRQMHPRHLPKHSLHGLQGSVRTYGVIYTDDRTSYRLDGNNVDMDLETALQAKNAIMYSTLTELVSRRFSALRTAISEGRR